MQCGHEAENDAGNQRETDGEQQHVDVERNFAHARQEILRDFFQQIEPPDREEDTEDAGDRRGQHALGEKLENNPGARRAKRGTDGDFFSARDEAREQ